MLPLVVVAAVALALFGGCKAYARYGPCWGTYIPKDPRAYPSQDHGCVVDWTSTSTDTYEHMLQHYAIALPESATAPRYRDSTSFNGPDWFFLRFSAPEADIAAFLSRQNATPSVDTVAETTRSEATLIDEYRLDDWHFDGPPASYTVYRWDVVTTDPDDPDTTDSGGWLIVDRRGPIPTVFLFASA